MIPSATTIDLNDAELAVQRAWERGAPVLWSVATELDGIPDVFHFISGTLSAASSALWVDKQRTFALAGIGSAQRQVFDGWTRFADSSSWWQNECRWCVSPRGERLPFPVPMAFAGFCFDVERPTGEEWTAFPDGVLQVPELLLVTTSEHSWLVSTIAVPASSDRAQSAQRMEQLIEQGISRLRDIHRSSHRVSRLTSTRSVPESAIWRREVAAAARRVRSGELDKVVLARSEVRSYEVEINLSESLQQMEQLNTNAAIFAFGTPTSWFVGASPETLVKLQGGLFETVPLAGSAPRGETEKDDERFARALLRSRKDLHEHEVVVGAILQALDLVADARPDSESPTVVKHRTVQHLATVIRGTARPNVTALDIVGRLHPTPAVGGYPVEDALAAIRSIEPFDRGWYAGPIGWVDALGDGEFAIGIRSALVQGTEARLYAGCGIVGDSDPDSEFRETEMKLQAIGSSLGTT